MKKKIWNLDILVEQTDKVSFDRELTLEEAIEAYQNDDFEDVIDEDRHGFEVVGGS